MNAAVPIMLAHGEEVVLPALLLIAALVLIVYPGALWVLANSRDRSQRRLVVSCAGVLALVCGGGAVVTLKDLTWRQELGDFIGLLLWAIPAACSVVALIRVAASGKHERDLNN